MVHGCDPNAWHIAADGTTLNLLHRAIILKDTATACFLIRNGADVNSSTRPTKRGSVSSAISPGGIEELNEGQFSPPLHMACERGLHEVVRCLVDHHVNVNVKVS